MKNQFAAPWSLDHGQLRNCKGETLAYIPIYPDGIGGPDDLAFAQLIFAAPELKQALETMMYRYTEHEAVLRQMGLWTEGEDEAACRKARVALAHSEGKESWFVEGDSDE